MKTWAWRALYLLLLYLGFIVAVNTVFELQDRREEQ